jgi:hypothetical protein
MPASRRLSRDITSPHHCFERTADRSPGGSLASARTAVAGAAALQAAAAVRNCPRSAAHGDRQGPAQQASRATAARPALTPTGGRPAASPRSIICHSANAARANLWRGWRIDSKTSPLRLLVDRTSSTFIKRAPLISDPDSESTSHAA